MRSRKHGPLDDGRLRSKVPDLVSVWWNRSGGSGERLSQEDNTDEYLIYVNMVRGDLHSRERIEG